MGGLRLNAYAKVNYALDVLGVRPDGYHEVRTVMQSVSLADEVTLERSTEGFELRIEPPETDVGPPDRNTAYLAWKLLRDRVEREMPVRVTLRKRIPAGAGLGGGSADAAAVLCGLNELYRLGLGEAELRNVAAGVGADVPFCVAGGTMLGEGIGDELTALPSPPGHRVVIAKPAAGAETAGIYRLFDERPETNPRSGGVVGALESGDLAALAAAIGNDLAPVTKRLIPKVAALEGALLEAGALGAAMTGTGTAVYGIFGTEREARGAAKKLDVPFAAVCAPVSRGSARA